MSQHTPGPLTVRTYAHDSHSVFTEESQNPRLRNGHVETANCRNRADALLYAASPELLASLKRMKELFFSCISDGNGELEGDREAIAEAERIIAKAEGR